MEDIIGDINEFAIEFTITNKNNFMGYARLWLSGKILGDQSDLIFFDSYLFGLLEQICNSKIIEYPFPIDNQALLYFTLKKYTYQKYDVNFNGSKYCCTGATFTDDFFVFSYLDNNCIVVLWKVRKNPSSEVVRKLGFRLNSFRMQKEKFCKLVKDYKEYILIGG